MFRLVAGQDPDLVYKSLEEHVTAVAPTLAEGLRVEVQRLNPGAKAYKVKESNHSFYTSALLLRLILMTCF